MLSEFAGLNMRIPEGWFDISDDLPSDAPPTLAPAKGVGALQFSIARYARGAKPAVSEESLKRLLIDFSQAHSFGPAELCVLTMSTTLTVGSTWVTPQGVVAAWYLSNGTDVVLVTYTGLGPEDPRTQEELSEATAIVQSIEFG